ncbi:glycerophosphodiester phosphodiesterase 1 [Chironomus tepperi]|uniref:glycerophosphodiester phosphodiesterase 1 n=1 Tax=Chironomus tepperi TaxID=113505 RepID=UPI00391F634B
MFLLKLISFIYSTIVNLVWFLSNFTIFLIHYFFVLIILFFLVSKFIKLKSPPIPKLFSSNSFCIAFYGGIFDVPENTKASIEYSISKHCPRILLSLSMTQCGKLVVLDKETLEKVNIHKDVNKVTYNEIKDIDVSSTHPLGAQYGDQKILTLDCLVKIVEPLNDDFYVILHAKCGSNAIFLEKLKQAIATHEPLFTKKFILCSNSPLTIYKLRKLFPNLMCAIWMDNLSSWRSYKRLFRLFNFFRSIYDVILRNLITPLIGVHLVFIHKDEFNTHISELWQNYDVVPIVYYVNSPSEKRYYQNIIKTPYLTASLRSEPQIIFNSQKS